jgi:hypothetical protein
MDALLKNPSLALATLDAGGILALFFAYKSLDEKLKNEIERTEKLERLLHKANERIAALEAKQPSMPTYVSTPPPKSNKVTHELTRTTATITPAAGHVGDFVSSEQMASVEEIHNFVNALMDKHSNI